MRNLREDLKHLGYDQEEAYFHGLNRELIEKLKLKKKGHLTLVVDNTKGESAKANNGKAGHSNAGNAKGTQPKTTEGPKKKAA